jgi:hypothetical protein
MSPRTGLEGCRTLASTGTRYPVRPVRSESLYRLLCKEKWEKRDGSREITVNITVIDCLFLVYFINDTVSCSVCVASVDLISVN